LRKNELHENGIGSNIKNVVKIGGYFHCFIV